MPSLSSSQRESFWRNLIARRESLNLTVGEVCQQAGVSRASFFHWRKRLGTASRPSGSDSTRLTPLVPVRIVDDEAAELILELPLGIRLRVPQGCDETTLQRVLRIVLAVCQENTSC